MSARIWLHCQSTPMSCHWSGSLRCCKTTFLERLWSGLAFSPKWVYLWGSILEKSEWTLVGAPGMGASGWVWRGLVSLCLVLCVFMVSLFVAILTVFVSCLFQARVSNRKKDSDMCCCHHRHQTQHENKQCCLYAAWFHWFTCTVWGLRGYAGIILQVGVSRSKVILPMHVVSRFQALFQKSSKLDCRQVMLCFGLQSDVTTRVQACFVIFLRACHVNCHVGLGCVFLDACHVNCQVRVGVGVVCNDACLMLRNIWGWSWGGV